MLSAALLTLASCSPPADHSAEDAQFIAQHGGDPKALDDRFGSDAQIACSVGADDYLRQQTNREFKWSEDAQGFTGVKFAKISTASAGSGMLTLFTDRALVSNGLGSFETYQFYCLYDAANKKVLQYSPDDPGMVEAGKAAADNASDAAPAVESNVSNEAGPADRPSVGQSFNPPDHLTGGLENEAIPDGPIAPPNFPPSNSE